MLKICIFFDIKAFVVSIILSSITFVIGMMDLLQPDQYNGLTDKGKLAGASYLGAVVSNFISYIMNSGKRRSANYNLKQNMTNIFDSLKLEGMYKIK